VHKFAVILSKQAVRDLRDLPDEHAEMILDSWGELQENPFPRGKLIKKIKGTKSVYYRLRVNQYRAFYEISGRQVIILRVVPKKDADKYIKHL